MSLPTEATDVILSREAVAAFLIEFVFVSETKRVWNGFGKLVTLDDKEWDGIGELVSIDGLAPSFSASAPTTRIGASGVSSDVLAAAVDATEYRDQPLIVYLQPFADRALSGNPVPIALRFMKSLEITRDAGTRTISVNCEGPYVGRRRPPAAWYSDSDQQKRHPGDQFCERVPYLLFKKDRWPNY